LGGGDSKNPPPLLGDSELNGAAKDSWKHKKKQGRIIERENLKRGSREKTKFLCENVQIIRDSAGDYLKTRRSWQGEQGGCSP